MSLPCAPWMGVCPHAPTLLYRSLELRVCRIQQSENGESGAPVPPRGRRGRGVQDVTRVGPIKRIVDGGRGFAILRVEEDFRLGDSAIVR